MNYIGRRIPASNKKKIEEEKKRTTIGREERVRKKVK